MHSVASVLMPSAMGQKVRQMVGGALTESVAASAVSRPWQPIGPTTALTGKVALARVLLAAAVEHQTGGIDVQLDALALVPQPVAFQQRLGDQLRRSALRRAELIQKAVDRRLLGPFAFEDAE